MASNIILKNILLLDVRQDEADHLHDRNDERAECHSAEVVPACDERIWSETCIVINRPTETKPDLHMERSTDRQTDRQTDT
jgi:hypothetical protein